MYTKSVFTIKLFPLLTIILVGFFASQANAKIDPANVVGMWLFNEDGGDVAKDGSKAGNDGTIVGPKKWAEGKFGKALEFNGKDVYVEVKSNKSLVLEELTMMGWAKLKPSQGTRWQSIMMRGQDPRNYLLVVDKDSQKLQLSITKGAPGAWAGPIAGPVVTDGKWHHLVGVIGQKAGLVIYADGIEVGKEGYAKPSLDAKPDRLRIGDGSDGGHQAEGLLDEVALFNVPLEEGDIVKIMNDGLETATGLRPVEAQGKLDTTWGRLKESR
jgi:hypothetical protein